MKDRIGWATLAERAHDALRDLPGVTVLSGMSMGAAMVGTLLPHRPDTAGVLHAIADIPATVRDGLPIQLHAADPDDFAPPAALPGWLEASALTWQRILEFLAHPSG